MSRTNFLHSLQEDIQGCNAAFRYHGDRADFSVTSNTKAKVTIADEKLLVAIDAKGDDDWVECTAIDMTRDPYRLPKDWLVRAHVGITASTGQLADNHDVISLNSFTDAAVLEAHVSCSNNYVNGKHCTVHQLVNILIAWLLFKFTGKS